MHKWSFFFMMSLLESWKQLHFIHGQNYTGNSLYIRRLIYKFFFFFFLDVVMGVHDVVRCSFELFLVSHFLVWFSQNHNCISLHFCDHICKVVYKMRFEWFEANLFFKFSMSLQYFSYLSFIDCAISFKRGPTLMPHNLCNSFGMPTSSQNKYLKW